MNLFSKLFSSKKNRTARSGGGIDYLVGSRCVVEETIDYDAGCGQVRVGTQSWSARAVNPDEVYEVGESLRIVAIEGVKLICRK